jgi:acyl-CoA synthetase (AMP-forming)/AMP-acid ligase II
MIVTRVMPHSSNGEASDEKHHAHSLIEHRYAALLSVLAQRPGLAAPAPGRVVDRDGRDVPRGTSGELWCRGFNVMSRYWEDPGATAGAITPEGRLRTGDIAVMDDRGFVRIVDRSKDM